jgi:hypothetical protein
MSEENITINIDQINKEKIDNFEKNHILLLEKKLTQMTENFINLNDTLKNKLESVFYYS